MIRPEHARLVNAGAAADALLRGALHDIVYFGTDTYFNIGLIDGTLFTVRQQNRPGEDGGYVRGDQVGITFLANAIRVLRG
jgi:spermidine/putrescine transport system ATP-binding protein